MNGAEMREAFVTSGLRFPLTFKKLLHYDMARKYEGTCYTKLILKIQQWVEILTQILPP